MSTPSSAAEAEQGFAPLPVPAEHPPEEVARRLTRWLGSRLSTACAPVVERVRPPEEIGGANELYVVDARWLVGHRVHRERLVVKLEPTGYQLFLDPKYDETVRLLGVMADAGVVPVPELRWREEDPAWLGTRFHVMSFVPGRAPSSSPSYAHAGWIAEASPREQRALWTSAVETVAAVHRVPPDRVTFVCELGPTGSGLQEQLGYWERALRWAGEGRVSVLGDRTLGWLRETMPQRGHSSAELSWGDARLRNLLFRDGRVAAVLDWDLVSLAGPMADLGYFLFYDFRKMGWSRLPGVGSREETIGLWESLTGRDAGDVLWYEAFAGFRLMVQRMRKNSLLRGQGRAVEVAPDADDDNEYTRILRQVLEEAGA